MTDVDHRKLELRQYGIFCTQLATMLLIVAVLKLTDSLGATAEVSSVYLGVLTASMAAGFVLFGMPTVLLAVHDRLAARVTDTPAGVSVRE